MALLGGKRTFRESVPTYARNLIRNGDGIICQRGTTIAAPNDDVYIADGWIVLQESNGAVDFTQDTSTIQNGSRSAIELSVNTANEKFGIFQPIENADTWQHIATDGSLHLSLSFEYNTSAGASFASVYGAIVSWDGTADTITSDIVGTWEDSATVPTLDTDWAYEGTSAASTPTGTTWKTVKVEGVPVDTANVNNIGVFLWHNDTASAAGTLRFNNVMLNVGKKCAPFERRLIADELNICQRTFWSSYNLGVAPGTASSDAGRIEHAASRNINFAANEPIFDIRFPTRMRTTPTGTVYASESGNSGHVTNDPDGTPADRNAAVINEGETGMTVQVTEDPGATALACHVTADADL